MKRFGDLGKVTLPEISNTSPWLWILPLALAVALVFAIVEWRHHHHRHEPAQNPA